MSFLVTLADTLALGRQWIALEASRGAPTARRGGRHLALFAWALPPSTNAGVHRPLSFLRYGPGLGWRLSAFHGHAPAGHRQHGAELMALIPPAVRMHEVADSTRQPSHRWFPRVDGGFKNALAFARQAIATLASDPPDVVMASGPPFFVFVAARYVARHFGVPLVLDYRDEWTECPFDFVDHSGNDLWWERRCLRDASQVLFVTESLRRHALATFEGLDPARCHHLANGWEPQDFPLLDGPAAAPGQDALLRLAHVGNLAGHTPPQAFLESLGALVDRNPQLAQRVRVQLIGRRAPSEDAAVQAFRYREMLELIDHVPKQEAAARMRSAGALLLLSMPELDRSLPSKLIDYVAARRPILVFGSRGESSDLVMRLGVGLLCPAGDPAALESALGQLATGALVGREHDVQAWLEQHRRGPLAARLFDLLGATVDRQGQARIGGEP